MVPSRRRGASFPREPDLHAEDGIHSGRPRCRPEADGGLGPEPRVPSLTRSQATVCRLVPRSGLAGVARALDAIRPNALPYMRKAAAIDARKGYGTVSDVSQSGGLSLNGFVGYGDRSLPCFAGNEHSRRHAAFLLPPTRTVIYWSYVKDLPSGGRPVQATSKPYERHNKYPVVVSFETIFVMSQIQG